MVNKIIRQFLRRVNSDHSNSITKLLDFSCLWKRGTKNEYQHDRVIFSRR